ncbi:hypothetical protein GCM10007426_30980 [Alloalcanivorax dieselolei]|nr:hypothetical protein GCM10007426_30980 [Alloalcanivorax dieselolei]
MEPAPGVTVPGLRLERRRRTLNGLPDAPKGPLSGPEGAHSTDSAAARKNRRHAGAILHRGPGLTDSSNRDCYEAAVGACLQANSWATGANSLAGKLLQRLRSDLWIHAYKTWESPRYPAR